MFQETMWYDSCLKSIIWKLHLSHLASKGRLVHLLLANRLTAMSSLFPYSKMVHSLIKFYRFIKHTCAYVDSSKENAKGKECYMLKARLKLNANVYFEQSCWSVGTDLRFTETKVFFVCLLGKKNVEDFTAEKLLLKATDRKEKGFASSSTTSKFHVSAVFKLSTTFALLYCLLHCIFKMLLKVSRD